MYVGFVASEQESLRLTNFYMRYKVEAAQTPQRVQNIPSIFPLSQRALNTHLNWCKQREDSQLCGVYGMSVRQRSVAIFPLGSAQHMHITGRRLTGGFITRAGG